MTTRTSTHRSHRITFETDASGAGEMISGPDRDAFPVIRIEPRKRTAKLSIEELGPGQYPADFRHGTYVAASKATVQVDAEGLDRAEAMLVPLVRLYCDVLYSSLDLSDSLETLSPMSTAMQRSGWIPRSAIWKELMD